MSRLITSCGIILNPELPRAGIISANSLDQDFISDIMMMGTDLNWDSNVIDLKRDAQAEGEEKGLSEAEIEELFEEKCEEANLSWESDGSTYLFGDWKKDKDGKYEIDKEGKLGFSLTYSISSNSVSVEWSKTTKKCHYTSPCYVMADGSGPCGDLDTPGDSVVAFSLPEDVLRGL